jgi:hypothetical protein
MLTPSTLMIGKPLRHSRGPIAKLLGPEGHIFCLMINLLFGSLGCDMRGVLFCGTTIALGLSSQNVNYLFQKLITILCSLILYTVGLIMHV